MSRVSRFDSCCLGCVDGRERKVPSLSHVDISTFFVVNTHEYNGRERATLAQRRVKAQLYFPAMKMEEKRPYAFGPLRG